MAEATIPKAEEIRQLPCWAQVAFAARCARRAQPLFVKHSPDARREHLEAIESAIQVVEESAAHATTDYTSDAIYAAQVTAWAPHHAADTVVDAAFAVVAIRGAATRDAARAATPSVRDSVRAATRAGVPVDAIRADFDFLLERSKREKWDDKTPVPPSVFPPLDAEPPEPEQSEKPEPLTVMTAEELQADETIIGKIRFFGKPGITAQELAPHIRSTYQALNELTLAKYGKYLKLADFKRLVLQYAGVPQS